MEGLELMTGWEADEREGAFLVRVIVRQILFFLIS